MDLDYYALLQCVLALALEAHLCHFLGDHFEHLVGSPRRVKMAVPHLTALRVDLVAIGIMVVLRAYQFLDHSSVPHHLFSYNPRMLL